MGVRGPAKARATGTPRITPALAITVTIAGLIYLIAVPALNAQEARGAGNDPATSLVDHGLATASWWVALVAVLLQAALTLFIRRSPLRILTAHAVIAAAASVAAPSELSQATLLAVIPAAYVAARRHTTDAAAHAPVNASRLPIPHTPPPNPLLWWTITAALVWVARTASALPDPFYSTAVAIGAGAAQALLGVGLPALIGVVLRGRAEMYAARERELIARADEQEARTEAALAAERTAIARELHDIAAHHLSGIAIMASAISQQVDTDPAAAKASLRDVRTQTRTLLDELRGLVTLLRSDESATVAVESLAGVERLIDSARLRGQRVTLTIVGASTLAALTHGIGPLSQFAAYRTIQEALANASRHAPGAACEVTLSSTPGALEIDITNASAPPRDDADAAAARMVASPETTTGFGLRGMQERAALTKSRLSYGPTDDGGWHVTLTVPREESR